MNYKTSEQDGVVWFEGQRPKLRGMPPSEFAQLADGYKTILRDQASYVLALGNDRSKMNAQVRHRGGAGVAGLSFTAGDINVDQLAAA